MRIARPHMYVKMRCVKVHFAAGAAQCSSPVAFLHT